MSTCHVYAVFVLCFYGGRPYSRAFKSSKCKILCSVSHILICYKAKHFLFPKRQADFITIAVVSLTLCRYNAKPALWP